MGTSGKKRTTMAKLNRESKLRDKRADKQARKAARKLTGPHGPAEPPFGSHELDSALDEDGQPAVDGARSLVLER